MVVDHFSFDWGTITVSLHSGCINMIHWEVGDEVVQIFSQHNLQ